MEKIVRTALLSMFITIVLSGCGKSRIAVVEEQMKDAVVDVVVSENSETQDTEDEIEEIETEIEKIVHSGLSLNSIELTEDGTGLAVYDGVKHEIIVNLPERTEGAPLVLMLHGYGESAAVFMKKTAFEQEANPLGYAVIYVTGAPSPEDKTSATGWNSGIGISSNKDVEFLCALVNELCNIYAFDRNRAFAVGFSNGAFMAHRLALEANDIFAAVVSVAGKMPENIWADKPGQCKIGILQITGEKDDVVPKNIDGSAKFSKAPAIEEVMKYYVEKNGLSLSATVNIGKKSILEKYTSSDTNKQVWNILIPDGRHSWPDEALVGFSTNKIIIEFLETE